ncbi:MAG: response regulator [Cyanobacteriota bacterium]|nr:response regulator [Cyanobacteriota bacterium]
MIDSELNTIFIVDDNPNNIKVLFDFLRNSGFRVLVAKDGESALAKLEETSADLILLDIMMPGIDGFETCRRLKANPKTNEIPVIFMTALADTDNKVRGLSLGAVDYITKPFEREEILARINMQIQFRELTKELAAKNAELKDLNAQLEEKVEERTRELKKAQFQLILGEKMSSLGQLVAGVAHEINNPIGFIAGNLSYATNYAQDLINLLNLYQKYYPEPEAEIKEQIEAIELDYLVEDFPQLIDSMMEGTKRITQISKSMRTFSRSDAEAKVKFDIHKGIDSTLLILKHRLKANQQRPDIEVIKEYCNLPEIDCYPGQLNQVFMNIIANAIDAFDELNSGRSWAEIKANRNEIKIKTEMGENGDRAIVKITDNGIGMPPLVKAKIFDHLFTTKGVGKGTGLGLSITREIIEDKHGGVICCNSAPGKGTEFTIALPVSN